MRNRPWVTRRLGQVAYVVSLALVAACSGTVSQQSAPRPQAAAKSRAAVSPAAVEQPKTAAACEGPLNAPVALVEVGPDTPKPRCLLIRPDQRLRVVNATTRFEQPGTPVVVTFARWAPRILEPDESVTFGQPLGQVLDPGIHELSLEVGGQHWTTEIWLKEASRSTTDTSSTAIRVAVPSHCGVLSVHLRGVLWLADPALGDHNPPPGWDENETPGYLTKTGPRTATFLGDGGQTARFRRAPAGTPDPATGCE